MRVTNGSVGVELDVMGKGGGVAVILLHGRSDTPSLWRSQPKGQEGSQLREPGMAPSSPSTGTFRRAQRLRLARDARAPLLVGSDRAAAGSVRRGPVVAHVTEGTEEFAGAVEAVATQEGVSIWLTTCTPPPRGWHGGELDTRREALAFGLLARTARIFAARPSWEVLHGDDVAHAVTTFAGSVDAQLIAIEAPPDRGATHRDALRVAARAPVPVLLVQPTVTPPETADTPRESTPDPHRAPALAARRSQARPGFGAATRPARQEGRGTAAAVAVLLAVIAVVGAAAARVSSGYAVIIPGNAAVVDPLIEGADLVTFPRGDGIRFVTVTQRRASVWEAVVGWLDQDVDVVPEGQIASAGSDLGMVYSKGTAAQTALRLLGHQITEQGDGAVVTAVGPASAAREVLHVGDVVVAAGGETISFAEDLRAAVMATAPGAPLQLELVGRGMPPRRVVTVWPRRGANAAAIGTWIATSRLRADLPVALDVATGAVTGPSGGLAFTLAFVDVLTPGALTGAAKVAATGTLDGDGRVVAIGALRQKVRASERAGTGVLLVPRVQEAKAARHTSGGLRVVGVSSVVEALEVLEALGGDPVSTVGSDDPWDHSTEQASV